MKKNKKFHFYGWTLVILLIINACGQDPRKATSFKTLFDLYKTREDIVALSLPPGLLGLVIPEDDAELSELKKLMAELSAFRMLSVKQNDSNVVLTGELRTDITEFTHRNEFSDLFRIQNGQEEIFIRILEKDESIKEAVLMISSETDFYVINLRGNISLDLFHKLAESGALNELSSLSDLGL